MGLLEVPGAQRLAARPSLKEIFRGCSVEEGIALAYGEHGYRLREVAEYLEVHYAMFSRKLRKLEQA
jgi:DNA-binding MarR family transcriptional regulator